MDTQGTCCNSGCFATEGVMCSLIGIFKDVVGIGVWHIESPGKAPGWFILERVSCLVHKSGLVVSSRVVCPY